MEKTEKDNSDAVKKKEGKDKKTELATGEGEQLYLEVKACTGGFSQWEALSPMKRARYDAEAKRCTHLCSVITTNMSPTSSVCVCVILPKLCRLATA